MKTIFLEIFERKIITFLFITGASLMLDLMANMDAQSIDLYDRWYAEHEHYNYD